MQEASGTMAQLADVATEPQSAVDAWTALVDAYTQVSETVTNGEIKAAATAATEDIGLVRDAIAKIYVDGDTGALSDLTTAASDMQTSSPS